MVKKMSALVSSQASKKKERKYVCDFCLNMFGSVGRPHGVLFETWRRERYNAETGKEYPKVQEHPKLRRVSRKNLR